MANSRGYSSGENGFSFDADDKPTTRPRTAQNQTPPSMADYVHHNYPANARRNATAEFKPPTFHRGDTTDTIRMTPAELDEAKRCHDLANVLPANAAAVAREAARSGPGAVMLAAKRAIEGLAAMVQVDKKEIDAIKRENEELKKELDHLKRHLGFYHGPGSSNGRL